MATTIPIDYGISIPNAGAYTVALDRFAADLTDFREVWDDPVFPDLEAIEAEEFAAGGGRHGAHGAWASLSERYLRWKLNQYGGERGDNFPTVLTLSGALEQSLTGRTKHSIRVGTRTSFIFGSTLPYGGYHQHGRARGGVARRALDPARNPKGTPWMTIPRALLRFAVKKAKQRAGAFIHAEDVANIDAHWESI